MQGKKQIRNNFRRKVFLRDNYSCRVCGKNGIDRQSKGPHYDNVALDAHHITPREQMPNGGYVKANGITVCDACHIKVEDYLSYVDTGEVMDEALSPANLYKLINSSLELAIKESEKLNAKNTI